jgi:DNA-binding SARP family transcriptional activator
VAYRRALDEKFMNAAHLQLLHCFHLAVAGRSVAVPMSAQRLLAFLALHPHALRRVHVAGSLWLDSPEDRAFASLRSALWRLQRAGADVIETRGPLLALAPWVRVDIRDAAVLARSLLAGCAGGRVPAGEWGVLAGDLLPDWDEDWVIVEREHHRQLSLQALERLAERLLEAGVLGQALEVALGIYVREPLRESAHRLLIRVHLADGNANEAIRQYRLFERLTLSRIGLPPSTQMRDLVRDLVVDERAVPGAAA